MSAWRRDGTDILLAVRVTPRAAKQVVGGQWRDAAGQAWLSASVAAPPDKGRANAALIALMAETLSVRRTSISLEAGDSSRLKRLRITAAPDDLGARLEELAGLR